MAGGLLTWRAALLLTMAMRALAVPRDGGAETPPLYLGNDFSLPFAAKPSASYCLVSDPCLHVNALMDSTAAQGQGSIGQSWVQGVGIRSGKHTLILRARSPWGQAGTVETRSEEASALSLVMLDYTDVRGNISAGRSVRSEDGHISLGVVEQGRLLVSLLQCRARLLLRLAPLPATAPPKPPQPAAKAQAAAGEPTTGASASPEPRAWQFLVDVLDWQNLDAPHGILGQMLPRGRVGAQRGAPQFGSSLPRAKVDVEKSVGEALAKLQRLDTKAATLEGSPGDYLTSGLVEPDCLFSRFAHDPRGQGQAVLWEGAPPGKASSEDGEDGEEGDGEEAQASALTMEHVARSSEGLGPLGRPSRHAQGVTKIGQLRGGTSASASASASSSGLVAAARRLSKGEMDVIAATHGTVEEAMDDAESEVAVQASAGGFSSTAAEEALLRLPKGHLEVISRTQGTDDAPLSAAEEEGPLKAAKTTVRETTESSKWRNKLSRADIQAISQTQGTPEEVDEEGTRATPGSVLSALGQAALRALGSMQGTRDGIVPVSRGFHLTKHDADVIASTQGTLEATQADGTQASPAGTLEEPEDEVAISYWFGLQRP